MPVTSPAMAYIYCRMIVRDAHIVSMILCIITDAVIRSIRAIWSDISLVLSYLLFFLWIPFLPLGFMSLMVLCCFQVIMYGIATGIIAVYTPIFSTPAKRPARDSKPEFRGSWGATLRAWEAYDIRVMQAREEKEVTERTELASNNEAEITHPSLSEDTITEAKPVFDYLYKLERFERFNTVDLTSLSTPHISTSTTSSSVDSSVLLTPARDPKEGDTHPHLADLKSPINKFGNWEGAESALSTLIGQLVTLEKAQKKAAGKAEKRVPSEGSC